MISYSGNMGNRPLQACVARSILFRARLFELISEVDWTSWLTIVTERRSKGLEPSIDLHTRTLELSHAARMVTSVPKLLALQGPPCCETLARSVAHARTGVETMGFTQINRASRYLRLPPRRLGEIERDA